MFRVASRFGPANPWLGRDSLFESCGKRIRRYRHCSYEHHAANRDGWRCSYAGLWSGISTVLWIQLWSEEVFTCHQGLLLFGKDIRTILTFAGLVGFIFAPQIISLFRDDPEVVTCGALSLRFQCAVLFTHSWVVMSTMMLQTIGRTYPATFLSVARQGLFLLPAILILPHFCGLLGVQMAQAVADCIALGFALVIHIPILKKMQEMEPYAEDIST